MLHIALLGDSVFDNAAYTHGAPDVVRHLRAILPTGAQATLCAADGATTRSVAAQIARVPAGTTHVVVSIGGNDALGNRDLLSMPVRSTTEALTLFGARVRRFEADYVAALDAATSLGKSTALCTIYNGYFSDPDEAALARTALTMFNDVIVRSAFSRRMPLIDLRLVCGDAEDYVNSIEPSDRGGRKIAYAVAHAVGAIDPPPGTIVTIS